MLGQSWTTPERSRKSSESFIADGTPALRMQTEGLPASPLFGRSEAAQPSPSGSMFSRSLAPIATLSKPSRVSEINDGPKGLVAGFLASLSDDTDLAIKLGDRTWKVHSALMSAHSPSFDVICNGQWKESQDQVVEIHDGDATAFVRFLQFVYCGDYEGNNLEPFSKDMELYLTSERLMSRQKTPTSAKSFHPPDRVIGDVYDHLEIYELADKYGCQALQDLARRNLAKDKDRNQIHELDYVLFCRDLGQWRSLIDKDEKLKEIFSEIIASNYRGLRDLNPEAERIHSHARGWLRWLDEDKDFCSMVMNSMSKRF